jgi:hypothetical protein
MRYRDATSRRPQLGRQRYSRSRLGGGHATAGEAAVLGLELVQWVECVMFHCAKRGFENVVRNIKR